MPSSVDSSRSSENESYFDMRLLSPCQWFCLVKSSLGVLLGFAAFITFLFAYHNYEAGIWAFSTGVIASICLHLHYLECAQILDDYHSAETLRSIQHLGFVASLIGMAFFIWYLFFGFYYNKGLYPIDDSPYIKAVWAYLCTNFGAMLYISCRSFIQFVEYLNI